VPRPPAPEATRKREQLSKPKTHLLIDGDIIAFMSAAAAQGIWIDSAGWHQPIANETEGEAIVENVLHGLKTGLKGDSYSVYLSDPEDNWRKQVDPTYKATRADLQRPMLLDYLKQYLRDNHGATHWAGLEADDVLGILATDPKHHCGAYPDDRYVVVGRDKDFKSIPGLHHSIKQDVDAKGNMLVREVSQWEADRFHMMQTLAGDRVDGYFGCPGIGMDRAAVIVDTPMRLIPKEGVKTRGVNKGEAVTKWVGEPTQDYWACIVSHYAKAGLTEDDALRTARLARILRYGEYDRETESVTLWTPDKLKDIRKATAP